MHYDSLLFSGRFFAILGLVACPGRKPNSGKTAGANKNSLLLGGPEGTIPHGGVWRLVSARHYGMLRRMGRIFPAGGEW